MRWAAPVGTPRSRAALSPCTITPGWPSEGITFSMRPANPIRGKFLRISGH